MGDLNDDATDRSIVEGLRAKGRIGDVGPGDMFNPFIALLKAGYGSLAYRDDWNLFDNIIVSDNLATGSTGELKIRPVGDTKFYGGIFRRPYMIQKEGGSTRAIRSGRSWATISRAVSATTFRPISTLQNNTLKYVYETESFPFSDARGRDRLLLCAGGRHPRQGGFAQRTRGAERRGGDHRIAGPHRPDERDGEFLFENLPAGDYTVQFSTPEFEDLEVMVRVSDEFVRDLKSVVIVPTGMFSTVDGAVFAESDDDAVSDMQALPGKLSSSKDLFSNIASYRFSEMRFNVRGLDAQYSDIMLNGIRFNDAMTGYGPWSLWSGLNDATRNQENVTGLEMMDYGIGGIGGMTNINARASQMRKGIPRERVERQPALPLPGDGLLRFRTARQRLVVRLLVRNASGRQRLCGRNLL